MPTSKTKLSLPVFFMVRKRHEEIMQKELTKTTEKLLALIPAEFSQENIQRLGFGKEWLLDVYDHTIKGLGVTERISTAKFYGFSSKKEAAEKLALLQTAWKDHIEVTIRTVERDVKVEYRIIL